MLRRGDVFAGYVIERELGRGGMGSVYAARHPRLPKLTALKLLHREFGEDETRQRFEREADLVARLDHPNIVTVYDRGVEDELLWISMQYVDGVDTSSVPAHAMSPTRATQIIVQIAAALDYAHRRGVLHRDVKPANILLSRSDGVPAGFEERVLLTDFGIGKLLDDTGGLTRTGTLTATLAYASPEQLSGGDLDHRSDQYSLACTLFRLLTGSAPYESPHVGAVVYAHLQTPPPSVRGLRPDLPAELDAVLAAAMAKDATVRYASCSEFAEAAVRALRTHPTLIAAPRPMTESARRVPTSPPSRTDIVRGALFGGAVGDALGAPVESMPLQHIRQRYGLAGVTGAPATFDGRISEETQLTLFVTEALIKGSVRARARGIGGATLGLMQSGMLVWLRGQGFEIPDQPFPPHSTLADHPELMSYRGVSHAAVVALQRAAARRQPGRPLGTRAEPVNDSKGCAAVVRSAPCGFGYAADRSGAAIEHIFELGCDAAALTHGHPSGWLPAGTMAAIVYGLCRGADLAAAVTAARAELVRHAGHEETETALADALRLASETGAALPSPDQVERLGRGWIAPEALAIGVFTAATAVAAGGDPEQIVRNGILAAVNHSGDSDATAAICGSLLGARYGVAAIPTAWRSALDAAPVIDRLANDYCVEFGANPPRDDRGEPTAQWLARYSG
ncbi:ADP-ribosylglycohydrolase family protein [Nocardia bovistercoris]|uniref:non-specific serine/threonine protein kinase n=1 Tax=Nocardia bovistercoris TaxID=2785916 RepID=A0A931N2R8_9NOCA|nr:ADP-ribosylglycohydrolase family protein [Nocardia bovistercoris]MBH0775808.1 ADP-ribosylglycohydrolase family protein [Nocardia bovistercoris]